MSRSMKVGGDAFRITELKDCAGTFGSGDAGAARSMVDRHGVVGSQRSGVVFDHRLQMEPLAHLGQDGHAELASAVGDHEIHASRRIFSAAQIKSPSFSRSSASTTIIISPRLIAATASSMVENMLAFMKITLAIIAKRIGAATR